MEQIINEIYPDIEHNNYELIGPDERVILSLVWEEIIEPDWVIMMRMREPPTSSSSKPEIPPPSAGTQVALVEPRAPPITISLEGQPSKKKLITLKDATGQPYLLPFDRCQKWQVHTLCCCLQ